MTREEAIGKWIYPAIATTWNEKKCKEILEALEQEPVLDKIRAELIAISEYDYIPTRNAMEIIDKYKAESEEV